MVRSNVAIRILFICVVLSQISVSQSADSVIESTESPSFSLFDGGESIPSGSGLLISGANSPFGNIQNYFTGRVTIWTAGAFSASYIHDISFGTPLGKFIPTNQLEVRIQLLDQRHFLPAVTLIYQGMVSKKSESNEIFDFMAREYKLLKYGLRWISTDGKQKYFGIGLSSKLSNKLSVAGIFGIHQFAWQQKWTTYVDKNDPTGTQVINKFPLPPQNTLSTFFSGSVVYYITEKLTLCGFVKSIPLLEIEPSTFLLFSSTGYQNSIGVRYLITNAIRIELTDMYQSGYIHVQNYHHLRMGVSTYW